MKVKNAEIKAITMCVNSLTNKGLSGASGYKVIKLQSQLEAEQILLDKAHAKVVESFIKKGEAEIKPDDKRYPKVMEKLNEVYSEEFELKEAKFLTADEIMASTEGLKFDMIKLIDKYLAKKEEEVKKEEV